MRTNLPVTSNEIVLRDDTMIVSKTDLKGRITYVNRDFLDISGFTEKELIGEPHNIVRHPDMPAEAFEDLWDTLKAGRPWTGYVKNRCKNGDYYWVLANATPIWDHGQVTGYLSVRRKASRDDDPGARGRLSPVPGKAPGRFGDSVAVARSAVARWRENLTLAHRIGGLLGLLGALVLVMSLMAIVALSRTNDATVSLYEQRFDGVRILGRITQLMGDNRMQIALSGLGVASRSVDRATPIIDPTWSRCARTSPKYPGSGTTTRRPCDPMSIASWRKRMRRRVVNSSRRACCPLSRRSIGATTA